MISCTEFIPLYSEFFKFLEARGGHDEVVRYWKYISDNGIGDKTNPNSLISHVERDGLEGAWKYWGNIGTEEACDRIRTFDKKNRVICNYMRHCPSKGMLLELKHIEPYHDYCEHCNVLYPRLLEEYGIIMERDHSKVDNAECKSIIYEKGHRPESFEIVADDSKIVEDIKQGDNKYLHRDFHLSGDMALTYCGKNYGDNAVCDFLSTYTKNYYSPQISDIKNRGLIAIKEWIEKVYEVEESSDVLNIELGDDCITITIDHSPVIEYMHSLNQKPGKYYIEETRTVYSAIADACNLGFSLEYYNEDGGTQFKFFKRKF